MNANTDRQIRRLRILCLHGYGHNGIEFVKNLGDFARLLADRTDLIPLDGAVTESGGGRCWWKLQKDRNSTNQLSDEQIHTMKSELQASLDALSAAWRERGPFDGVLGFSQGGVLSAIVLQLQESTPTDGLSSAHGLHFDPVIKFKFALLFNCCQSRRIAQLGLPTPKISTPTLLAVARNDSIIPISSAREFRSTSFHQSSLTYFEHDEGHWLPLQDDFRELFDGFISKAYQRFISS